MFSIVRAAKARLATALFLAIAVSALLSFFALAVPAAAESDVPLSFDSPAAVDAGAPSCRYGVAALETGHVNWLEQLNVGWYVNFTSTAFSGAPSTEFAPIIRVRQQRNGCTRLPGYQTYPALDDANLGAAIRSRPGALWLVGNEPDRGPGLDDTTCTNRVQDDTAPDVYARAYKDVYAYIKSIDPTAKVANAGMVQVTPNRLQYLDIVWNTYRALYGADMPVDVWNMHLYVLPEADPDGKPNNIANVAVGTDPSLAIRSSDGDPAQCARSDVYCYAEHDDMTAFAGQVVAMRQWMKDHGQQQKPLIISEYSLLYPYIQDPGSCFVTDEYGNCFTPTRVMNFLNNSLDYLETAVSPELGYARDGNRLVQRWLWYSVSASGAGDVSNLTDGNAAQISLVGSTFANRATAAPRTFNLFPAAARGENSIAGGPGASSVSLAVEVRNQGSAPTGQNVAVNFYRDAGLTDLIGSATVPAGVAGCGSGSALAQVSWGGLSPGPHSFWAKVDPGNAVVETQEDDNVIQGKVVIPSDRLWLPTLLRASGMN
jgi:hypothetical protein